MESLTQTDAVEQEICTLEVCLPGSWPYAHVHCSGCDVPIVFEGDAEDRYNLPPTANRCSQGHAKHRECECRPTAADREHDARLRMLLSRASDEAVAVAV